MNWGNPNNNSSERPTTSSLFADDAQNTIHKNRRWQVQWEQDHTAEMVKVEHTFNDVCVEMQKYKEDMDILINNLQR